MILGSLYVELTATVDPFIASMKHAQHEAEETEKHFKPLVEATKELGEAFSIVGDVVAAGMVEATIKTAEYGATLEHTAQKTGIAVEELAKLNFAAGQNGLSTEALNNGLKLLAKNTELAITGSQKQATAFHDLGITTEQLNATHGDMAQVAKLVADKFSGLEDGAAKTAISLTLMGKSGSEMIPFMNQGSEAIEAMGEKAEALGLVMTKEGAEASLEFERGMKQLQGSMEGVGIAIGTALMPMLTSLMDTAKNVIIDVKNFVAAHQDATRYVFETAAAIGGAGGLILALSGLLVILPKVEASLALILSPLGLTVGAIAAVIAAVVYFRDEIAVGIIAVIDTLATGFLKLVEAGEYVAKAMGPIGTQAVKSFDSARLSLENLTKTLDTAVIAGEAHFMTVGKTAKALEGETEQLKKNAEARDKAILKLTEHNEAAKKLAEENQRVMEAFDKAVNAGYEAEFKAQEALDKKNEAVMEAWDKAVNHFYEDLDKQNEKVMEAWDKALNAGYEAIDKANEHVMEQWDKALNEGYVKQSEAAQKAVDQMKHSAGKIFDDMFTKGQNVFDSLNNLLKGGALSIGRTIFEDVVGALTGPIKQAFDSFFKELLSGGVGNFGKTLANTIKGALSGSGGGAGGAASSFTGPLQSAAAGGGMSLAAGIPFIGGAIAIGSWIGSMFRQGPSNYEKWEKFVEGQGYNSISGNIAYKYDGQGNTQGVTWYDPQRQYKQGTDKVPSDGPAYLHKDEAVLTADDNATIRGLLASILAMMQKGGDVYLDGVKVGSALYNLNRINGVQLTGVQ